MFNPDNNLEIKFWMEADFSGNWIKYDSENSSDLLSITGYVIIYRKFPLMQ